MIKFFIGPMSKNIVDAILEFCRENQKQIGLIPSRRQVEFDGGYVNNWTTKDFAQYSKDLFLVRDHGGPLQGDQPDTGYESLIEDCNYFDMIHIDPWKKFQSLEEGVDETVRMIKFCHNLNPKILFEVGTEQSIRNFEINELDYLVTKLKDELTEEEFSKVKYLVIQSGTSLKGNQNTGSYDKERLISMVEICRKYGLLSKEHNGDYMPVELIHNKFDLGLNSINIAPEFGLIETQTYLDAIPSVDEELLEVFYEICFDSKRWVKWVDSDFIPSDNKIELIKICGHYVLSNKRFINEIKSRLSDIDTLIKRNIKSKLNELFRY